MYWNVSLFSLMLAAASLPLYIHLPRYATAELGLSLSTVGAVLIGIRVMDFAQDPALGWMVDRNPRQIGRFAALGAAGMGLGFVMLFSIPPLLTPVVWLTFSLIVLFTCYSLAAILFYGQSTALASNSGALLKLAGFREAGALTGVILAALAPVALIAIFGSEGGFTAYGLMLAVICTLVYLRTRPLWTVAPKSTGKLTLTDLRASGGLRLLGLALVNALPVAMTSTLFLFFVEDRLELTGMAGGFLVLFFLAAGLSVPVWTRLSNRYGIRPVLLGAMTLAVLSFVWAALLLPGAALAFALVCIGSGAALGADMVLLPVMFSSALERADLRAGQAFGLWFLAGKLALALAAALLLPALDAAGFKPGAVNSASALQTLTLAYAIIPCVIKLAAITLVFRLPQKVLSA
ncbi:MFS transporter [uncultured Shimia sp.]|uniref:MFS transporter n=1 Tax=uncultured Shimia sp. TaxID=573152 RepID=UPI00261E9E81|nr:MFS transporter [uncultured Shimia sp.]